MRRGFYEEERNLVRPFKLFDLVDPARVFNSRRRSEDGPPDPAGKTRAGMEKREGCVL